MLKRGRLQSIIYLTVIISMFFTGCGGEKNEGSDKDVEGKKSHILSNVVGGKTPEENKLFVKEIERLIGIKVDLEKPPSDYDQKMLSAASSGEKYDLMLITKDGMDILVDQGALTGLTDEIKGSKVLSDSEAIPTLEWER